MLGSLESAVGPSLLSLGSRELALSIPSVGVNRAVRYLIVPCPRQEIVVFSVLLLAALSFRSDLDVSGRTLAFR